MRFDRSIAFVHERRVFRFAGFSIPNPHRICAYGRQDKMSVLTEFRRVDRTARAPHLKQLWTLAKHGTNAEAIIGFLIGNPAMELQSFNKPDKRAKIIPFIQQASAIGDVAPSNTLWSFIRAVLRAFGIRFGFSAMAVREKTCNTRRN